MVTVRLPEEMEAQLASLSELENSTKTEIIRNALSEYLEKHLRDKSPYELGKDLFGLHGSGETDRSATYKERVKRIVREKHAH